MLPNVTAEWVYDEASPTSADEDKQPRTYEESPDSTVEDAVYKPWPISQPWEDVSALLTFIDPRQLTEESVAGQSRLNPPVTDVSNID